MNIISLGLYGLALFWTILLTALIGNVIADAVLGTPSSVNYGMFTTVLSWLTSIAGLVGSFTEFVPPVVLFATDVIAILFTFIASVVFAAKLGVYSCSNLDYISTNDIIVGSENLTKRCRELQASTAFFWFLLATYLAALIVRVLSSRSTGLSSRGGIHKGGPSMSQV